MDALRAETIERIERELPDGFQLSYLERVVPSVLWSDRDFCLSLYNVERELPEYIEHPEIPRELLEQYRELRDQRERVRVSVIVLELVSNDLKADEDFMIAMIRKRKSRVVEYASKELLKNPDFMLRAVEIDYWSLYYASADMKANRDFGLAAVKLSGASIRYLHTSLRGDKEIALAAVTQYGQSLQLLRKPFRADKEIALAAVRQCGASIHLVDKSLRKDKEINLEAVKQWGPSIQWVDKSLLGDKDIALEAIKGWSCSMRYIGESLRKDRAMALVAVTHEGSSFQYVHESLRGDKEIALEAIKGWGPSFHYLDESLYQDRDIALESVRNHLPAFRRLSDLFRNDREIAMIAISRDRFAATAVGDLLRKEHDVFAHVVSASPRELWNACQAIQDDISIITSDFSTLEKVRDFVDETRQVSRPAFMAFLGCIHIGNAQDNPCFYISAKNKGEETSTGLKQHIAGYLGFPFGESLARFHAMERTVPILEKYSAADVPRHFEEAWNGLNDSFFPTLR